LVSQIRPVEVIFEREFGSSDALKMIKNSPQVPMMSPLPPNKCYSFVKTCAALEKYFGDDFEKWPAPLRAIKEEEKDLAFNALGMVIAFLTDALIDEQTISPGNFKIYTPESTYGGNRGGDALEYMVLDA
jgi:hypothetical protein